MRIERIHGVEHDDLLTLVTGLGDQLLKWALCRYRRNGHYAERRIMPRRRGRNQCLCPWRYVPARHNLAELSRREWNMDLESLV
jgi:hypothetical protein